jgi:D-alanine-D-alanine ligase
MKNIAIVAGGNSSEWIISVKSAAQVSREIENSEYKGFVVQIKDQLWQVLLEGEVKADVDKNDFSFIHDKKKIKFDCALILIHGTPGEDGILQSYFELLGVPYTTCGVLASALTFNKYACKKFLKDYKIKSANDFLIKKNRSWQSNEIIDEVGLPCFVKPNESGSSFGITKVTDISDLEKAVNHALSESNEVIVEQFIKGTEVTCGVLKTTSKEFIFPITEVVSKREFFDYEAKYTPGLSDEITPARIKKELEEKVHKTSSLIYDAINCRGIVRIDYIISGDELYFLEVNTVPGMSENSIIPKQIREAGYTVAEVYKLVIEDAFKKV